MGYTWASIAVPDRMCLSSQHLFFEGMLKFDGFDEFRHYDLFANDYLDTIKVKFEEQSREDMITFNNSCQPRRNTINQTLTHRWIEPSVDRYPVYLWSLHSQTSQLERLHRWRWCWRQRCPRTCCRPVQEMFGKIIVTFTHLISIFDVKTIIMIAFLKSPIDILTLKCLLDIVLRNFIFSAEQNCLALPVFLIPL